MSQDVGGSVLRLGGEDHKGAEECGGAGENAPFHGWIAKCHQRDATQDAIAIEVADLIDVSVFCSLSVGVYRMVELLGLSFTIWYCSCTEQDPAACKIVWGDWRCPSCNLCKLRCQNNGPSGITYSTDSIDWDMLRSFQIFFLSGTPATPIYSYLLFLSEVQHLAPVWARRGGFTWGSSYTPVPQKVGQLWGHWFIGVGFKRGPKFEEKKIRMQFMTQIKPRAK